VLYQTCGFLDKNADRVSSDLIGLMAKSTDPFVAALVTATTETTAAAAAMGTVNHNIGGSSANVATGGASRGAASLQRLAPKQVAQIIQMAHVSQNNKYLHQE
jgi:myosin heavy subunit